MCGEGKTSWAIQYMNDNKDLRFIFVTPYLSEVTRVMECCGFETPSDDKIKKIDDFKRLINEDKSIVTTHKLLSHLTVEMVQMIKNSNYILILDEVIEAVSELRELVILNRYTIYKAMESAKAKIEVEWE